MKRQIRIPTIIGIILTLVGIFFTTYLIKKTTNFFSKASPDIIPKNVRLTNLSDTKFSISFITDEPTVAFLALGETKTLGNVFSEDREALSGKNEPSYTHYITATNLKPETTYYFKIGSGGKTYGTKQTANNPSSCSSFLLAELDNEPFSIKTVPSKMISCRENPLSGEVNNNQSLPAFGSIICVEINDILPVSDYVKSNGKWVIPCYNLTLKNGQDFLTNLSDNQSEIIYIDNGKNGQTKVINKTGNDNPVPLITLNKDLYNLTQESALPTNSFSVSPTSVPTLAPIVTLLSPQGTITDDLPTFRGEGKPGQVIKIEVRSTTPQTTTLVIDENGNWSWTPPRNLTPGNHTVTITAIDEFGNQHLISKTFTIAGLNPLLPITSGTQSADLTLTPTPTPNRSITQIPTQTPTPTISYPPSPTVIYLSPTPIPTLPLSISDNATDGSLLNTGNEIPIFTLLTIAIISFTIGLRSKFLKKKA